jgi:hypothetical protein
MNDSIKREQSELAYAAERENLRPKGNDSIKREQRENLRPKGKKIINPWRNHEGYNCFG